MGISGLPAVQSGILLTTNVFNANSTHVCTSATPIQHDLQCTLACHPIALPSRFTAHEPHQVGSWLMSWPMADPYTILLSFCILCLGLAWPFLVFAWLCY